MAREGFARKILKKAVLRRSNSVSAGVEKSFSRIIFWRNILLLVYRRGARSDVTGRVWKKLEWECGVCGGWCCVGFAGMIVGGAVEGKVSFAAGEC